MNQMIVKFSDDVVDSYGVTHKKDEILKYYQQQIKSIILMKV